MGCYHPIPAEIQEAGSVRLNPPLGYANTALPCGKCLGCKSGKATEWARRCEHEAKLWQHNSAITLTYDDDRLPPEGHLEPNDFTKFVKRLRKRANSRDTHGIVRDNRVPVRYFACGEYGDTTQRPHYHALLFNAGFSDRRQVAERNGRPVYHSEALTELWGSGHIELQDASPAAANYIAQYTLKKQGRSSADADGVERPPPFLRMSHKPAIGIHWLRQYKQDLINGYVVVNNVKYPIPRRYMLDLKKHDELLYDAIKHRRTAYALTDKHDPARLSAQEQIHWQHKSRTQRDWK